MGITPYNGGFAIDNKILIIIYIYGQKILQNLRRRVGGEFR